MPGDGNGSTVDGTAGRIVAAVYLTIFAVFFVLICCCFCRVLGCRCPSWRARNRRTTFEATTTTTANTSTYNTTAANVVTVPSNTGSSPASPGAEPNSLVSTPSFEYKSADAGDKLECAVCLMKCKDGEKGRILMGCGHSFHAECIDMWFRSHSSCPICRYTVETTTRELPV